MIVIDQETITTIRRLYETSGWDAAVDQLQRRWHQLETDDAFEVIERVLACPGPDPSKPAPRRRRITTPYAIAP